MHKGRTRVLPMPISRPPRATMSDVARKAGVSEKSVSRVVNQEPHVSAKLKAKVDAAIAELGYVPDTAARSLAGARSFTISMLMDTRGGSYFVELIEGAYNACKQAGYHLRIENIDSLEDSGHWIDQLEEILRYSRLDGIILPPPFCDNSVVMDYLEQRQIPYSRVSPYVDRDRAPAAFMDDAAAAAEIADLLVSKGHRRFGLVNGLMPHGAAIARRKGFIDRIAQIAPDAQIVEAEGRFEFATGIAAGRELLSMADRPTAIFAVNDDSAAGVMTACAQLGIKVPDEVSICGFDDSWVAKSVWPYLTTVYQPVADLACQAALMLIGGNKAAGDAAESNQLLLAHKLIERDSVSDVTR